MIVLDTHALLWWALDPGALSRRAAATCDRMGQGDAVGFASAISIWELGIKIKRGKLDIGTSIEEFARRIELSGIVELVPVDTAIWLRTVSLEWSHRDPADRVIVATAELKGVPVLSKDPVMRRYKKIRCIW